MVLRAELTYHRAFADEGVEPTMARLLHKYTYALKVSMPFWKRLMENFGNFADGGGMLTLDGKKIIFHRELACRPRPLICPKCRKYHTFWA